MNEYLTLKVIHIVSSTVLFGLRTCFWRRGEHPDRVRYAESYTETQRMRRRSDILVP
jgi:uncharacterized membrane protein